MNQIALSILIAALQPHQLAGFGVIVPSANRLVANGLVANRLVIPSPKNIAFVQRNSNTCRFLSSEEEYEEVDEEEFDEDEEEEDYEEEEDPEDDEEEDAEYEYTEVEDDVEDEEDENIPLEEDPDDPNYNRQKKLIEDTIARRDAVSAMKETTQGPDSPEFFQKNLVQFIEDQYEKAGLDEKEVDNYLKKMSVSEEEADEALQQKQDEDSDKDLTEKVASFITNLGNDSDAFPPDDDPIYQDGIKNEDLVRLQKALEGLVGTIQGYQDGSLVDNKQAMIRPQYELDRLDRQTLDEINLCLNASATDPDGIEYSETISNEDPIRWLLYDLDFDVANLMLAACKHNPEAPLLLNHWMPQLCAYSRYADVRDKAFQFTWEDCEKADIDELKRYYQGLGYDEIPSFVPKDTNVIELETEYDQADMTMAAFENWMDEVYIEEDENLYFDDEDFQPENNVFDFNYGMDDTDDLTSFKAELNEFKAEYRNETKEWKDKYVRETNYTYTEDVDGAEQFRGHLVVACCGSDQDLELAEKITNRMEQEFDKMVYVETRVYSHARQEDNLYEIWLESYDIELLHSRRGAFYNAKQWLGPADVDVEQLDNVVNRVKFLISDDARFSYRLHEFVNEV